MMMKKKKMYIVYLVIVIIVFTLITVFIIKQSNSNTISQQTTVESTEESNVAYNSSIAVNDTEQTTESYTSEDIYSSLTNSEKKAICNYIERRYDYYDTLNGGYSGDKYSDTIMQEAANEFGITAEQAYIIWCNKYSY